MANSNKNLINELSLLTKNDIPFEEGRFVIHPPTLKEIGTMGDDRFLLATQLLTFTKSMLNIEDETVINNTSDFEILMTVMNSSDSSSLEHRYDFLLILTLLFPDKEVYLRHDKIIIQKKDENNNLIEDGFLDKNNFGRFKEYISEIFCLAELGLDTSIEEYNPEGAMATRIAKKLRERKKKLAELKNDEGESKISLFSRYMSILSVGMSISLNELSELTIYQINDTFKRYKAKLEYDYYVQAKMVGAKGMEKVEDWMRDLKHSST